MDGAIIAVILCACVCCIILAILWIPTTGMAPLPVLQCWTSFMRAWKCGDAYGWNWSKVQESLYIGTLPRIPEDLIELRDTENVQAVVTMNEDWETLMKVPHIEELGMVNLLVSTPDYSAPRLKDVQMAVEWAVDIINRGGGVYVHCNAGRGRSAVVVVCILMAHYGMESRRAYEHVAQRRRVAKLPHLCETKPQWRVVLEYERLLNAHQDSKLVECQVNPAGAPLHSGNQVHQTLVPAPDQEQHQLPLEGDACIEHQQPPLEGDARIENGLGRTKPVEDSEESDEKRLLENGEDKAAS